MYFRRQIVKTSFYMSIKFAFTVLVCLVKILSFLQLSSTNLNEKEFRSPEVTCKTKSGKCPHVFLVVVARIRAAA